MQKKLTNADKRFINNMELWVIGSDKVPSQKTEAIKYATSEAKKIDKNFNPKHLLGGKWYAKGGKMATGSKYYVMDAKNGEIISKSFDSEEQAKVEMYKLFEKTNNKFLVTKKMEKGGTMNTTENLKRRLKFIAEDVDRLFETLPQEVLEMPVEGWENVKTLLSNIEIATDLSSDESDSWKFGKKMAKGGSILSSNYSIGGL
jgi:hypothetical protein